MVSRDIDKKSTYSRKLETQFKNNQQKQMNKNRKLLEGDTLQIESKPKPNKALLKQSLQKINPLMTINKERKKQTMADADDPFIEKSHKDKLGASKYETL